MSETVTVAFITSLSTISGGIIVAITSILIHKSQIKVHERLSDRERGEQSSARRREVRREAYVQLLTRFDEIDSILQRCWQLHPAPNTDQRLPEEIIGANESISSITTALNVVNLEGPPIVAQAGTAAGQALRSELSTIIDLIGTNVGRTGALLVLANDDFGRALRERQQAKQTLTEAARAALQSPL